MNRWKLEDLVADETYLFPINPNAASSPFPGRELAFAQGAAWVDTDAGLQRTRVFESPPAPAEWEFSGVLRTKEQHDELLRWSKKSNEVRVSDHLGRTFEVIIRSFRPLERRPTPDNQWRMTYTVNALVLGRVA